MNSIKCCANLGKSVMETLAIIRQAFEGRNHEPYMVSTNSPRPKKVTQVKSKVKSILIIFSHIKGIIHKKFVLAGQTVNSAYYCDVL
jgi:hypothetical protein